MVWQVFNIVKLTMLSYIATFGYNPYTKSNMLQQMLKLMTQHPNVQKHFSEGIHVIQSSIHLWAGFSSDFFIEQGLIVVEVSPKNDLKLATIMATVKTCLCS